jgi:hypothetical protein
MINDFLLKIKNQFNVIGLDRSEKGRFFQNGQMVKKKKYIRLIPRSGLAIASLFFENAMLFASAWQY